MAPVTTKIMRHPNAQSSQPTKGELTNTPIGMPATPPIAAARPRSWSATQIPMTLVVAGNAGPSPMPSRTRQPTSEPRPVAVAVSIVAPPQTMAAAP